jgi:uncharacterized protein
VGEVVWLGRYPVKSMFGEDLTEAELDESGVVGDRRYALIDEETGLVVSAKNPRKWRALLTAWARYLPSDGQVALTLPDGVVLRGDGAMTDAALSRFLGRPVRLSRRRPEGAMMERLTPEVELSAGDMTHSRLGAGTPGKSFVDFAPIHVVTTATLSALGRAHQDGAGAVDARRFRPNVVVRMFDEQPFIENTWPGRTLSIGTETAIRVIVATPRCAVPTLAHGDGLPDDPEVLRAAARLNRVPVLALGALTCVGAYAGVDRGGRLRVGDRVIVA